MSLPAKVVGPSGRVVFGPGLVAANDTAYGEFVAGGTWNFQVWYRDEPMCEPTGQFNLSNADSVVLTP